MVTMPAIIAKYLALEESNIFDMYDKFAYLIKAVDGDSYYLTVELPERNIITEEFGVMVYDAITDNVSYKDIFSWYNLFSIEQPVSNLI